MEKISVADASGTLPSCAKSIPSKGLRGNGPAALAADIDMGEVLEFIRVHDLE
jgi:hypothetical protein